MGNYAIRGGKQAISLDPQILFSRTTNNVDPLVFPQSTESLNILLVLGTPTHPPQNLLMGWQNRH